MPGVDSIAIEIHNDELNSTKNVIVLALYRPPNINAAHCIIKLTDTMQTLHEQNKHVFLMGNFNIDITEVMLTTNRIVNDFHNLLLSYHFYNLINKPNRVTENKSSIIDKKICEYGIFKTDFSDHYSIFCVTDLTKPLAKNNTVIKREFNANNIRKFNEILNQTDWGPVYNLEDFNESYCYLQKKIDHALNLHFPVKTVEIKYNNRVSHQNCHMTLTLCSLEPNPMSLGSSLVDLIVPITHCLTTFRSRWITKRSFMIPWNTHISMPRLLGTRTM